MQYPHSEAGSSALGCCALHRIAFPVVSKWYQQRHPRSELVLAVVGSANRDERHFEEPVHTMIAPS